MFVHSLMHLIQSRRSSSLSAAISIGVEAGLTIRNIKDWELWPAIQRSTHIYENIIFILY